MMSGGRRKEEREQQLKILRGGLMCVSERHRQREGERAV